MTNLNQKTNSLATENIGKLIWTYSIPAIVGTVVMSLYNIIDRIFIGQGVGASAISGLALTFPFMIFLMAFGMLVGAGAASRISITLGQNDFNKAERILGNALTLTVVISIIVSTISFIFLHKLLALFGGNEHTIHYAEEFMQIIIPGSIFSATNYGFNNIMRASGYPRKAMYTMIICAIINVILAPIFIFGLKMGIQGAAIATTLTYIIGSVWVLQHFMQKKSNIRLYKKNLNLNKEIVGSILSIGMSPFSMQIAACFVVILVNLTLIKYGGDNAIGAYGIVNGITTLIVMIIIGLNQGTQPIVGYNFGAKNYSRMFETLKKAVMIGTSITTFGFVIGMFFPSQIVSVFTTDEHLREVAARALRITVIMFPIVGSQIVITNFFQSIGKAKISIFLSLIRQFLFLIPCIVLLPYFFGLDGAWAAIPVADTLSSVITFGTIYTFVRDFNKEHLV